MVLDTRFHRGDESPEGLPLAKPGLQDIEKVLERAVTSQCAVVEEVRALSPGREDLDWLWGVVADKGDNRRLVAAQIWGCHRQWLSSAERLAGVLEQVRQESDPAVRAVLVWGLRHRDEVGEFLCHREGETAREAALGVPLNGHNAPALLAAIHRPPNSGVWRILSQRLQSAHVSLVEPLIEGALQHPWNDREERLEAVFAGLPQVRLFEIGVERGRRLEWKKGPESGDLSIRRRRLARVAGRALLRQPSTDFLHYLLKRFAADEGFARSYNNFIQEAFERASAQSSPALLRHLAHLGGKAAGPRLLQMAQLVVRLEPSLEPDGQKRARALLEAWQERSPQLRLKVFHLKQGLE